MLLPNQCSYASHQRIHQHKSPYTCPECGAICRSVHFQTHVTKNCLHYTRRVGFRSVCPSFPGAWSLCRVLSGPCSAFSFSYRWYLDQQILWEPRSFVAVGRGVGGVSLFESLHVGLMLVHAKPRVKGALPARQKWACGKAWLWSTVGSLCTCCPPLSRLSLSCCLHFNPCRNAVHFCTSEYFLIKTERVRWSLTFLLCWRPGRINTSFVTVAPCGGAPHPGHLLDSSFSVLGRRLLPRLCSSSLWPCPRPLRSSDVSFTTSNKSKR